MKINKFNVNTKSKFRKNKLVKGIAALGLTSIVATSFASCGEKKPLLKDTILENAVVAEVDGNVEIIRNEHVADGGHKYNFIKDQKGYITKHDHYVNIVTGEWLANGNNVCYSFIVDGKVIHPRNVIIENICSIDKFLTKKEYDNALSGNFTNSDLIEVVTRIKAMEQQQEITKSK